MIKTIIRNILACKYVDEVGNPLELNMHFLQLHEILTNPTVARVINQQLKGKKKYNELVNPDNYDVLGWLEHLAEEQSDALIYVQCAIERIKKDRL